MLIKTLQDNSTKEYSSIKMEMFQVIYKQVQGFKLENVTFQHEGKCFICGLSIYRSKISWGLIYINEKYKASIKYKTIVFDVLKTINLVHTDCLDGINIVRTAVPIYLVTKIGNDYFAFNWDESIIMIFKFLKEKYSVDILDVVDAEEYNGIVSIPSSHLPLYQGDITNIVPIITPIVKKQIKIYGELKFKDINKDIE